MRYKDIKTTVDHNGEQFYTTMELSDNHIKTLQNLIDDWSSRSDNKPQPVKVRASSAKKVTGT